MGTNTQFTGLWAIILGGSSGFGFASAEKLAGHGMNIAVLYRETSVTEKPLLQKLSTLAAANNVTILPYNVNALTTDGRASTIQKLITEGVGKNHVKFI